MEYVIWSDDGTMWAADVFEVDAAWLRDEVLTQLQPLDDAAYTHGPAAILHTEARHSYVLDGERVLWCVGWDPGLLVIAFDPSGAMSWATAPVPETLDEEVRVPALHLVMDPWDAQLDEEERELAGFSPASPAHHEAWDHAMAHVANLGDALAHELGDDEAKIEAWRQRCMTSPIWQGTAV